MNFVTPTELARIITRERGEPFSKQAVFKALAEGLIPFQQSGKKKLVDLDNQSVQSYIRDDNRQREAVKKNETEKTWSEMTDKKQSKKPNWSNVPIDKHDNQGGSSDVLDMHEMKRRKAHADMRKKELEVLVMEKKYLPTDFIEDVYITYLEKFNSNVERFASTFIKDIGKKILDAGEILPEHIEAFTSKILETIHNNKKSVKKEITKYEPRL